VMTESTSVDDMKAAADAPSVSLSPWATCCAYLMLLLATTPDAMFPPVLKVLLVERYEVGVGSAFWFMAVNMVGVLAVLPVLPWLRRVMSPGRLIALAAVINGVCYWLMSLPLGLEWTLCVRAFEGAPDMVVLASLLALVGRSGDEDRRGFRFGLAGTVMMLGLVIGLLSGGIFGERFPSGVFVVGAIECGVLAMIAVAIRHRLPQRGVQVGHPVDVHRLHRRYPIWPAMLMYFCDRGLGGALTIAGAVYVTFELGMSSSMAGRLPAITLFLMVIFNGPVGWLADRVGLLRVRVVAFPLYGLAFLGLSLGDSLGLGWLYLMFILMGCAGAGLIPTSLALGARAGGGATDMGLLQTSGQFGYFIAIVASGLWVAGMPGPISNDSGVRSDLDWSLLFIVFGLAYIGLNMVAILGVVWRKIHPRTHVVTCSEPT
jgi:MFS family permease